MYAHNEAGPLDKASHVRRVRTSNSEIPQFAYRDPPVPGIWNEFLVCRWQMANKKKWRKNASALYSSFFTRVKLSLWRFFICLQYRKAWKSSRPDCGGLYGKNYAKTIDHHASESFFHKLLIIIFPGGESISKEIFVSSRVKGLLVPVWSKISHSTGLNWVKMSSEKLFPGRLPGVPPPTRDFVSRISKERRLL